MPKFNYTARGRGGQQESGALAAASVEEAIGALRQQGLLVLSMAEDQPGWLERIPSLNPFDYRSMNHQDVEQAFQQFAVLLRSGLALLDAVGIVADFSRPTVRKVWLKIGERIRAGSDLAGALGEHPIFGNLSVQLVAVGEKTGRLDIVLRQASMELEERRKIRAQLVSALIYPCFVLLFAIGVAIFMLVKIIPEIKKFLAIMGRKMPPITQALIDSSNWIESHALSMGVTLLASVGGFLLLYQWPPARLFVDTHALRLPVLGRIFRLSGTVVFSRTLALLLKSGVRIVDALELMEKVHYNRYLAQGVANARRRVIEGSSLAEPLQNRFGYMPLLPRMIVVGENSGALDEMLDEMTVFHDELLRKAIGRMVGLVGPAITVLVGGMIAFVYAAFLVAMFSAAGGSPK